MSEQKKVKPAIKRTKAAAVTAEAAEEVNKIHHVTFSPETKVEAEVFNIPANYPFQQVKAAIIAFVSDLHTTRKQTREILKNLGTTLIGRDELLARENLESVFLLNNPSYQNLHPTDRETFRAKLRNRGIQSVDNLLQYVPFNSTGETEDHPQAFQLALREVREERYPRTSPGSSLPSDETEVIPNPHNDSNRCLVPAPAVVIGPQMQRNLIELVAREENAVQANPDEISQLDGGESEQVTNRAPQAYPLHDDLSSIGRTMSEETGNERVSNAQGGH